MYIRRLVSTSASSISLKRSALQIAQRACATQLFLTRWGIEASLNSLKLNGDPETNQPEVLRISEGFNALESAILNMDRSLFTEAEDSLLKKSMGAWDPLNEIAKIQPRWESFGILLWAIRVFRDIAPYTQNVNERDLFEATAIIPVMPQTITSFQQYFQSGEGSKIGHVVENDELIYQVNIAEAYYWRSQAQIVVDLRKKVKGDDAAKKKMPHQLRNLMENIESVISQASTRAIESNLIKATIAGDFDVDGTPYGELKEDQLLNLSIIASKRLEALGWLCGNNEWDVKPDEVQFINPINSLWAPVV